MAKKPSVPCSNGCGRLLWTGGKPAQRSEPTCRVCRSRLADPGNAELRALWREKARRQYAAGRASCQLNGVPCSSCGKVLATSAKSLPEGERMCQICRRVRKTYPCSWCGKPAPDGRKTCSTACRDAIRSEHWKRCSRYDTCRTCGRASKRTKCSTCQGKKPRPGYTSAERRRRKQVVDAWRARYGERCPGWGEPAHGTDPTNPLTADHVVAVALGASEDGPLSVLCRRCNGRKGHRANVAA